MRKKLFSILALLMVAVTGAWAQNPSWLKSGDTWDTSTSTLTVNSNPEKDAYSYNPNIEKVVIAASVTEIGKSAFDNSYQIATVEFAEGSSLTTIGEAAFNTCGITSINIPASVTSVGNEAFAYCDLLVSVTFNSPSLTYYGASAFDETSSDLHISVPKGAEEAYKTGWPDYAGIISEVASGSGSGEETQVTIMASDYDAISSATSFSKEKDGITIAFGSAKISGDHFEVQSGKTVTITSTVGKIKSAVFTCTANGTSKYGPGCLSSPTAGQYSYNEKIGTWTGEAESFTLTSSNKVWIVQIDVTVGEAEPAAAGYTVSMKDGVKDADNWTAKAGEGEYQSLPLEGVAQGTEVTVTYSGTKKVKSVKAVKKAASAEPETIVWNSSNWGNHSYNSSNPCTIGDVTLSMTEYNYFYTGDGYAYLQSDGEGNYTFTAPTGKKFTKIEIDIEMDVDYWPSLGTGWSRTEYGYGKYMFTWTGSASSTVKLFDSDTWFENQAPMYSITFYVENE